MNEWKSIRTINIVWMFLSCICTHSLTSWIYLSIILGCHCYISVPPQCSLSEQGCTCVITLLTLMKNLLVANLCSTGLCALVSDSPTAPQHHDHHLDLHGPAVRRGHLLGHLHLQETARLHFTTLPVAAVCGTLSLHSSNVFSCCFMSLVLRTNAMH